jgi:hypothetical protein
VLRLVLLVTLLVVPIARSSSPTVELPPHLVALFQQPVTAPSSDIEYERQFRLLSPPLPSTSACTSSSSSATQTLLLGSDSEKTHCTRVHCSLAPLRLSVESDVHLYRVQLCNSCSCAPSAGASSHPLLTDRMPVSLTLSHEASLSALLLRVSSASVLPSEEEDPSEQNTDVAPVDGMASLCW